MSAIYKQNRYRSRPTRERRREKRARTGERGKTELRVSRCTIHRTKKGRFPITMGGKGGKKELVHFKHPICNKKRRGTITVLQNSWKQEGEI